MFRVKVPFLKREVDLWEEPGTEVSPQKQITQFWNTTFGGSIFTPSLFDRVWAANRCLQMTCQHLSRMPLRFYGPDSATEPAWVSSPDPAWFPNGIGDALFAAYWQMYASDKGCALLYVTARYANGFPRLWTVMDNTRIEIGREGARRSYRIGFGGDFLNPLNVVQIDRDPRGGLHGTSALQAFASSAWNLVIGGETAASKMTDLPPLVLKANQKVTAAQSAQIAADWANRPSKNTSIPVLPPELNLEATGLGLSPKDLLLLESQQFDAATIAAAFGMPALMLNIALQGSLVYQAPGQLFDYWWRGELMPRSDATSDALTAQMLPAGQSVLFDARRTLAPDFGDLVEAWNKMLDSKVVTLAEYRAAVLGLPPQSEAESVADLLEPGVAGASPNLPAPALVAVTGGTP